MRATSAYFNTSKVQLEESPNADRLTPRAYFNTSKVQLEGALPNRHSPLRAVISIPRRCN